MILSGQAVFNKIINELSRLDAPSGQLAILQVGNDLASNIYIKKKLELAKTLSVKAQVYKFNNSISEDELLEEISNLNENQEVSGILVQIPLPSQIDRTKICSAISSDKDVDGFGYILGKECKVLPPTIKAIDQVLVHYNILKKDKKIIIVGGGFLVGSPLFRYYQEEGCDVELLNEGDDLYFERLQEADIVILATGGGAVFDHTHFAQGSVVIDASTIASDSKLYGDLETSLIDGKFSFSPVPGGVGPVTVAMLFVNFYLLNSLVLDL
ncbi:MAG: Bifunctional protein FolD protein [candidate division WS2 bacterium ADurb.Bin280]|uniref:Bifunctional protein FolD protein n=1 Tax=candidate division WS2 bacterium ADurb.Bin280 TaxID=1852829 RepID=A0A1V5SET7_9BACT|nr:MAG: Bifunctional protein FolD protein [candidate division WS2 bacterium ADurb.Bin280]